MVLADRMEPTRTGPRPLTTALAVTGLAVGSFATWWLWLGRDRTYQVDPDTGVATGPYTTGQVAGCVVTLLVLAVLGSLLLRPWLTTVAMTVPFTAAWSVQAADADDTGLWLVGAVLLIVGMVAGTLVVGLITGRIMKR
jgi:hypothetical protein